MLEKCQSQGKQEDTFFMSEQECMRDVVLRLQSWLDRLEARVAELLTCGELKEMKPGEREHAISRHFLLMTRLLQIRQQYAKAIETAREQEELEELLRPENAL